MADEALVAAFDQEMFRIYERPRSEANYNATRFLHMLYEHRGLETARILLHSPKSQKAIQPSGSEDAPPAFAFSLAVCRRLGLQYRAKEFCSENSF